MNILITGANGFIGRNLQSIISKCNNNNEIMLFDRNNKSEELREFCQKADCVFHLAAVLRPENNQEYENNIDLTSLLLKNLELFNNKCPVMFSSSIQADLDNPYGRCKRAEEDLIIKYGKKNDVHTYVFRFPNLFGIMSRPNYTSVVATFCYNTIRGLPITINNPATKMKFCFVETILEKVYLLVTENRPEKANQIVNIEEYYEVGLGELVYYMEVLRTGSKNKIRRKDDFFCKLKQTYQWYQVNSDDFDS